MNVLDITDDANRGCKYKQELSWTIYLTVLCSLSLCSGGTLVFDESDIELQAENILITDGGRLQVGQEGAPFQHKAIITLHGNLRSPELPVYGTKTLAVREGVLDLHGMDTQLQLPLNRWEVTQFELST